MGNSIVSQIQHFQNCTQSSLLTISSSSLFLFMMLPLSLDAWIYLRLFCFVLFLEGGLHHSHAIHSQKRALPRLLWPATPFYLYRPLSTTLVYFSEFPKVGKSWSFTNINHSKLFEKNNAKRSGLQLFENWKCLYVTMH